MRASRSPTLALTLTLLSSGLLFGCSKPPPLEPTREPERAGEQPGVPEARPGFDIASFDSFHALGWPEAIDDRRLDVRFDLGAWFGFAPPDAAHFGSFAGPYDLRRPGWLGRGLGFELEGFTVLAEASQLEREPALLRQRLRYTDAEGHAVDVELELWFGSAEHLNLRARMHAIGGESLRLTPRWSGELFAGGQVQIDARELSLDAGPGTTPLRMDFGPRARLRVEAEHYQATLPSLELRPTGDEILTVRVHLGALGEARSEAEIQTERADNRARWHGYIEAARAALVHDDPDQLALAVKCVETLIANWRAPTAKLPHAGLFPAWAYDGFHGFWAWDSWKHAVALARFEPELAREQIRLMLSVQREDGMVPDVVYPGSEADNWRDSKPPLATWAVEAVWRASEDREFVREVLPALLRYHAWWYRDRDHDGDGLCEYGSTDGSRIAAAWESGMDNAVRFDAVELVENHPGAHSMALESVDLNAYLYADKLGLARLARVLDQSETATRLEAEAEILAEQIRQQHWDESLGWFRDRHTDGRFAAGIGPEGWIPLWAGLATPEQASRVRASMVDPNRFATTMPLGTLAADDPQFDPARGYWRGPVWLDQAYFGIAGLRRYGFDEDADLLQQRLLDAGEGLRVGAAIRENYHPLTGAGQNARHFSWSAAAILMLLWSG